MEDMRLSKYVVVAALNREKVNIVNYDWLEDTLQTRCHKREAKYDFRKTLCSKQKGLDETKKKRKTAKREGKPLFMAMVSTLII